MIKLEDSQNEKKKTEIDEYFDDIFNKLSIEHNVRETSFKHQFDETKKIVSASPYQSILQENDRLS